MAFDHARHEIRCLISTAYQAQMRRRFPNTGGPRTARPHLIWREIFRAMGIKGDTAPHGFCPHRMTLDYRDDYPNV